MKAFSIMIFLLCLNTAAFIISMSNFLLVGSQLYASPTNILTLMYGGDFTALIAGLGVGGIIGGLVALLTRQYVYAAGALIIWIIGLLIPIIQWFFDGVPMTMEMLGVPWYFVQSIRAIFAFIFFIFIIEVAGQRQIT